MWAGVGSEDGRALYACVLRTCMHVIWYAQSAVPRRRWKTQCRWGSTLAVQSQPEPERERLFISHYFDSRVGHLVSSELVLCLRKRRVAKIPTPVDNQ
jgi:hypothetical protein